MMDSIRTAVSQATFSILTVAFGLIQWKVKGNTSRLENEAMTWAELYPNRDRFFALVRSFAKHGGFVRHVMGEVDAGYVPCMTADKETAKADRLEYAEMLKAFPNVVFSNERPGFEFLAQKVTVTGVMLAETYRKLTEDKVAKYDGVACNRRAVAFLYWVVLADLSHQEYRTEVPVNHYRYLVGPEYREALCRMENHTDDTKEEVSFETGLKAIGQLIDQIGPSKFMAKDIDKIPDSPFLGLYGRQQVFQELARLEDKFQVELLPRRGKKGYVTYRTPADDDLVSIKLTTQYSKIRHIRKDTTEDGVPTTWTKDTALDELRRIGSGQKVKGQQSVATTEKLMESGWVFLADVNKDFRGDNMAALPAKFDLVAREVMDLVWLSAKAGKTGAVILRDLYAKFPEEKVIDMVETEKAAKTDVDTIE